MTPTEEKAKEVEVEFTKGMKIKFDCELTLGVLGWIRSESGALEFVELVGRNTWKTSDGSKRTDYYFREIAGPKMIEACTYNYRTSGDLNVTCIWIKKE